MSLSCICWKWLLIAGRESLVEVDSGLYGRDLTVSESLHGEPSEAWEPAL